MNNFGFDKQYSEPFFVIAGPCVIESESFVLDVAGELKEIAKAIDITGEGSLELIEAFEIRNSPVETSLPDANWVSLQNICNS